MCSSVCHPLSLTSYLCVSYVSYVAQVDTDIFCVPLAMLYNVLRPSLIGWLHTHTCFPKSCLRCVASNNHTVSSASHTLIRMCVCIVHGCTRRRGSFVALMYIAVAMYKPQRGEVTRDAVENEFPCMCRASRLPKCWLIGSHVLSCALSRSGRKGICAIYAECTYASVCNAQRQARWF